MGKETCSNFFLLSLRCLKVQDGVHSNIKYRLPLVYILGIGVGLMIILHNGTMREFEEPYLCVFCQLYQQSS